MSVKATKNCVEKLITKGINADSFVVLAPTVFLDTACLQSSQVDCVSKNDAPSSSVENRFESLLESIDVTEAELNVILTKSEEDNLLSDQIDCTVQAINSTHFDGPQCPTLRLQKQLQAKGLKIDVLEQNPLFFEMFKQKLYKEFQSSFSFFWYSPLLQ